MIKYKSGHYGERIEKVEVIRETENSVWLGKHRTAKMSVYGCYFDTWDDAKQHLVDKAKRAVDGARDRLTVTLAELDRAKALKTIPQEGGE